MTTDLDSTLQTKRFKSPDGTIRYIKDGKLHNYEGPALITSEGKKEYYINGKNYDEIEYKKLQKESTGVPFYKKSGSGSRY